MAEVSQLTPLSKLTPLAGGQKRESISPLGDSMFGAIFQDAINNVKETDADKVEAQYLLATGQLDNPAALMTAISKNQIAVDLLIQLRNKALDAYSELTRISL